MKDWHTLKPELFRKQPYFLTGIEYFPSYEIITTHANHCAFYDPDLRSVNLFGVNHVMDHFFRALTFETADVGAEAEPETRDAIVCDEENLANFQT